MANNGRRSVKAKKGPTIGTGGHGRKALEGKGPTPKAEDRPYHKAHKSKQLSERSAAKRGTGARGLRAILEELMTDVMFDLPSREDVVEVKVTESCITNGTQPLLEISPVRRKKEA